MAPHPPLYLASLLFDPPQPQIIGKTQCFATFLPFRSFSRTCIFFLLTLSLLRSSLFYSSLFSDSSHLCFSSVHSVGSLTSKLPSIIHIYIYYTCLYIYIYTYYIHIIYICITYILYIYIYILNIYIYILNIYTYTCTCLIHMFHIYNSKCPAPKNLHTPSSLTWSMLSLSPENVGKNPQNPMVDHPKIAKDCHDF